MMKPYLMFCQCDNLYDLKWAKPVDKCLKVIRNIDVQELKSVSQINDFCSDIGIVHLFHWLLLFTLFDCFIQKVPFIKIKLKNKLWQDILEELRSEPTINLLKVDFNFHSRNGSLTETLQSFLFFSLSEILASISYYNLF